MSAPGLAWQACLKKTRVKFELLTDVDMLLIVEKGIRDGICHSIHRYAKANNKYMKNYNKDVESSYLKYLYANNLYGWVISQKVPVNGFKLVEEVSKFKEDFIKNYDEDSNKGYFLEIHVEYPKHLFNGVALSLRSDLAFLLERNKIKNYVVHVRVLKQALNQS